MMTTMELMPGACSLHRKKSMHGGMDMGKDHRWRISDHVTTLLRHIHGITGAVWSLLTDTWKFTELTISTRRKRSSSNSGHTFEVVMQNGLEGISQSVSTKCWKSEVGKGIEG